MTIPGYGRLTPLQGSMLELGGEVLRMPLQDVGDRQRRQRMKAARQRLVERTNQDFGFDLERWHHFLLNTADFSNEYRHPYGWRQTQAKIQELIRSTDRKRLAREMDAESP